ncbi:BZ3500_MvSof-1268-A1-R1_Chr1-2g01297 [Microbotryum saponariae]|uniref:BZ3500_MvSof-1268-A1-R1_Chr1-2g01297 protein n=1 Tax=Microbotryum saponariae TaxID=289078 RepID=A0A2X0MRP2_9BASI|nr:BZ3500_MvSof-1268-A1-R1_Chr1-2g01297 [Microbotryum saponariae]SCZ97010.1 BZ3501_MvSof-1269-A2-R1_Chr1-2g00895 [Microbotryum saponariae]
MVAAAFENCRAEHVAAEGDRVDQFALKPKVSKELKTTLAESRKWIAAHIDNQTLKVKKESRLARGRGCRYQSATFPQAYRTFDQAQDPGCGREGQARHDLWPLQKARTKPICLR